VDTRAGLDEVEQGKFLTLPVFELRPLGRPTRTQLLHRLRYAGSEYLGIKLHIHIINFSWYFRKIYFHNFSRQDVLEFISFQTVFQRRCHSIQFI
jgi:hypothetical protein